MSSSDNHYYAFGAKEKGIVLSKIPIPYQELKPTWVEIEVTHNGICHSDISTTTGEWEPMGLIAKYPIVPGHEVVGIVKKIGSGVTHLKVGDRVGVSPQNASCNTCDFCHGGEGQLCLGEVHALYDEGGVENVGGFAQVVYSEEQWAIPVPDAIPSAEASVLLCAGITTWSPIDRWFKSNPRKNAQVAVAGLGGLGHLAVQFVHKLTKALGYNITLTTITTSPNKLDFAKQLGADGILVSTDLEQMAAARGRFDVIFNTTSGGYDVNQWLQIIRPRGKFVLLGMGQTELVVNPVGLLFGDKCIEGSGIGGPGQIKDMFKFITQHQITPMITVIPVDFNSDNCVEVVNEAYKGVNDGKPRFRYVLEYKQ